MRSLFVESDEGVSQAYSELIESSEKALDSILELQNVGISFNRLKLDSSIMVNVHECWLSKYLASPCIILVKLI